MAFKRLAQGKGQWTAFRETAAKDAVMFEPQKVLARDWLKGRVDPPKALNWRPYKAFVSCDGALGVTTGAVVRADGSAGYYTTIWRLDKKGRWEWIADHGDTLAEPLPEPDMIEGHVAKCRRGPRLAGVEAGPPQGARPPVDKNAPPPADESLLWTADVQPDGSRTLTVRMWDGSAYRDVITDKVGAAL